MKTIKVNEKIVLKQIELSDAGDVFNIINTERDYLGEWLPFVEYTKHQNDTESFIASIYNEPSDKQELVFVIRYENIFVGLIGFKGTDRLNKKTEIGYWLSQLYQKKGIITESVKTVVNHAFKNMALNRVQIKCAAGNIPSKNIPKRLGFRFEGIERDGEILTGDKYTDLEVYSILKKDIE